MEMLTLKNGAVVDEPTFDLIMETLQTLFNREPIAAYQLVMKCRDPNHRFFGNTGEKLKALGLIRSDESVHDTLLNIVLSAIEVDGSKITLRSPVQE